MCSARAISSSAPDGCTPAGSSSTAQLVAALLGRRREPGPLDELTEREREVLGLMAEGLTDRGIAERLWVTPKTVETHVRHILRKLDLPEGTAHNRRVHAVLAYLRA